MNIRHHLSGPLLMAYAAGSLPEAFNLVVATHVSLCDDCRADLAALEALGGAILDDEMPDLAMSVTALEAALTRLNGQETAAAPAARREKAMRANDLPAPLADYLGGDLASVKWQKLGLGVRQAILPTGKGAMARLLLIPAGKSVPDHGHRGTELTLVLRGAFADQTDRFGPGDLEIATQDLQHTPRAEAGEDCLCLAATDAPLRFLGLIPRLLQPLFRI